MTTTEQIDIRPRRDVRRDRDHLVHTHLELAYSIARRYIARGEELDDLQQVAVLGLVRAADRFDPSRGFAFSTLAMPTIVGTLKRHFRDQAWAIRPPRRLQERYLEVRAVTDCLTGELKRFPTTAEVAARGGWSEDEVREAEAQSDARYLEHWDADGESNHRQPAESDDNYRRAEARAEINDLLATLEDRERQIVELRFFGELGQADIGRRVGVSQMHVGRLLKASIDKVRSVATP